MADAIKHGTCPVTARADVQPHPRAASGPPHRGGREGSPSPAARALAEAFKRGTTITEMVFNGVSGAIGTMIGTWMMIIFGP
jgi:hypothetical protein